MIEATINDKGPYRLVVDTGASGVLLDSRHADTLDLPSPPGMPAGGHGGSHGPLANEFVTSILQDREPMINVYEALAMTVPGIVAHQSALKDGETLPIPQFDRPTG